MFAGGFLPVLMSWMVLTRPTPSPLFKIDTQPLPPAGENQDCHLSSSSAATYANLIVQLKQLPNTELEQYISQLINLLVVGRVTSAHMLSGERSRALDQLEQFILERCGKSFVLGFKVFFALKVWLLCCAMRCSLDIALLIGM